MSEHRGADIIKVARTRVGQQYVLGAKVAKDNPNWQGPWDCAEFASWCAYQAYEIVFGIRPTRVDLGDAYSGYWYEDAKEPGVAIPWQEALKIAGALVVRRPRARLIGHVAILLGDGTSTIEARGARFGVDIFDKAEERPWDIGVLLPGVEYEGAAGKPIIIDPDFKPLPRRVPNGFFAFQSPLLTGPAVLAIQAALCEHGYDPGPLDGQFGHMTEAAAVSFQVVEGLEPDGIVGPQTSRALGLGFPIAPSPSSLLDWKQLQDASDQGSQSVAMKALAPVITALPPAAAAASSLTIAAFQQNGAKHSVQFSNGTTLFVGSAVKYQSQYGLYQDKNLSNIKHIGVYTPAAYLAAHKEFAHFIWPTIKAESSGYFGRLNSYDRAAFTFGATQLAAHTPDTNLILLFRRLLMLPSAQQYFPELSLVGGKVTLTTAVGGKVDLEQVVQVTLPSGKKEKQLRKFMDYLNPDPAKIDQAEVSAAARLMLWTKNDPAARDAQIDILVERVKELIKRAKVKVPKFNGSDWRVALWIVDILYQGRGDFTAINAAMNGPNPQNALSQIGCSTYKQRCSTIKAEIAALEKTGVLSGFTV